jgi:hypothetical protein
MTQIASKPAVLVNRSNKRAQYASRTSGTGATGVLGFSSSIKNFLRGRLAVGTPPPVSTSTGSGTPAVYQPPTIDPPPSAAQAVLQQTNTSEQLAENINTGAGTGAGRVSNAITFKVPGKTAYLILAGLAALLVFAYMKDKGKL